MKCRSIIFPGSSKVFIYLFPQVENTKLIFEAKRQKSKGIVVYYPTLMHCLKNSQGPFSLRGTQGTGQKS